MEHLDLAGFITTPTHWTLPAFEQQDAIYLSNSRQMLEPILEETSEDEERAQNSWTQYEQSSNVWSSAESETGSVIRIEVTKDADSISERDFACPAKRARHSDECLHNNNNSNSNSSHYCLQPASVDDTVLLRKFQRVTNDAYEANNSLERFLAFESQFGTATSRDSLGASSQQRSSTGSRRFDDFYSDSDSLSYHSLSRSSSLIQFESLERQLLQDQHSSLTSLGNSSPSLLSFDGACLSEENRKSSGELGSGSGGGSGVNSGCNSGNNSRRGSQCSLQRRFESADGRLHQTYYDLDKLNFDTDNDEKLRRLSASKLNGVLEQVNAANAEVKSDSESSTSSSSSSGNSILNAGKPSTEDLSVLQQSSNAASRIAAFQRAGGKNSAENLSEDSGYCEPSTLRRTKSKSIPKNFEKFCEEDEFYTEHEYKAIEASAAAAAVEDDDRNNDSRNTHSKNSTVIAHDLCQPKIALDATFVVESATATTTTTMTASCFDSIKNSHARETQQPKPTVAARSLAHSPSPVSDAGSTSSSCASANSFTWLPSIHTQKPQQQQQRQQQQHHMMLLNNVERCQRLPQSPDFSEQLRNSLPDIRDANGSSYVNYFAQQRNGYALDPAKLSATPHHKQRSTDSLSDSDTSNSESLISSTSAQSHTFTDGKTKSQSSVGGGGRVASVPNELDKLGKSKKRIKSKPSKSTANSSSESELNDEDIFDINNARIRRSCSWSERRERNLQKFECAFGKETSAHTHNDSGKPLETQSLGYMNASYHNLTLLDYTGRTPSKSQSNFKRSSFNGGNMETRKSSGDYESIICKGNFLLDELSEIYDKNASILNDKQLDLSAQCEQPITTNDLDLASTHSPKAPPRLRQHSNSSYSDLDTPDGAPPEVQHVQLTIRKPPARQKHGRKQDAPSSLVLESTVPAAFSTFGKTFDQDPTNLRTSYAQSLEKCNFDAKELSNSELTQARALPKRRFQSHAAASKKRNLVSSTPNLNAYDPCGDELEDDIYVSSAHTSMHQLPQSAAQKPLGILLPTGSRSSFGKEVSFCPVVSKYSWQEQSSEECNEPPAESVAADDKEEEETDDELLDNADATVIYNTKENEMIATRFAEAQKKKQQQQQQKEREQERAKEREQLKALTIAKEFMQQRAEDADQQRAKVRATENIAQPKTLQESNSNEGAAQANDNNEKLVSSANAVASSTNVPTLVSHKTTTIAVTSSNETTRVPETLNEWKFNNNANTSTTTRPVSLHLPILSEPPTNRAHILYASQQLIDSLQKQQLLEVSESLPPERTQSVSNLNARQVENQTRVTKMSNRAVKSAVSENALVGAGVGVDQSGMNHYNNNNELMKSKFKADEKHPSSKGFLSRFANGFRFSLRRNKKKQQQQQQQQMVEQNGNNQNQQLPVESVKITERPKLTAKSAAKKQNSPDFIYIPLKGPLPAVGGNTSSASSNSANDSNASTASLPPPSNNKHVAQPASAQPIVTGKPPLPKQPPRLLEKLPPQQSAGPPAHYQQQTMANVANGMSAANQFYTSAKPTTIDECFLDSERSYYDEFRNQLNTGMHANGRLLDANAAVSMDPNAGAGAEQFSSPSRASVSQKTQMFNNMSNGKVYVKHNQTGNQSSVGGGCKIGLIETNLDTHETVISGKTRSLMELGPQQHQQRFKFIKRMNANTLAGGKGGYQTDLLADDEEDDDDDDDVQHVVAADGSIVVVKGVAQAAGQIASVRRPHKSMEFLLDKENQKNVLPPENELQKSHEQNPNALSEHQLRVQASLQRLNIPDWFRTYNQSTARSPDGANAGSYKPGNFTRKRTSESSGRWAGLNSKTTSLSSLGSQRSDRSPLLLSPSAHSHHGGQSSAGAHQHHQHHAGTAGTHGAGTGGGASSFSRWSTSHLNSSQTSPSCSQRGSFSRGGPVNSSFMSVASGQSGVSAVRNSFRQPYLGWRSQEKLSQRTPHERLASSLLAAQQQRTCSTPKTSNGGVKQPPVTPEIQSSIKEVTSAIVHYVNDQTQQQRSRSTSPNSRKCWLESSFVGTRPLDSPQTPVIENTTTFSAQAAAATGLQQYPGNYNSSNNYNNNNSISSGYYNNSSATSSIYSATTTTNADVLRMNGLNCGVGESPVAAILI